MANVTKQVEFEIKSPLDSIKKIELLLHEAKYVGEQQGIDTYYDVPTRDLFRQGVFVRVRNNCKLDIKYNKELTDISHTVCNEYGYEWPLSSQSLKSVEDFLGPHIQKANTTQCKNAFTRYGLEEFVTIKKTRKTYSKEGLIICLDDVDGLGEFVEIEAVDAGNANYVQEYCHKVGLINLDVGYVELFLRSHDFQLYKSGRYLLSSDK